MKILYENNVIEGTPEEILAYVNLTKKPKRRKYTKRDAKKSESLKREAWSNRDDAIMKNLYKNIPVADLQKKLGLNRTIASIYTRAKILGLRTPRTKKK